MFAMIAKINNLLSTSYKMVFLYFYILIPLFLRKLDLSFYWIILPAGITFLWYIMAKKALYKAQLEFKARFFLDNIIMLTGLAFLYFIEIKYYRNTNTVNLLLYVLAFLSYVPSLLSSIIKKSEADS